MVKLLGRAIEGTDAYTAESYAEPFTPTITKKKGKKVKTEADYDQEFAEVKRKHNNMQEYEKELSKITNDLFVFNDGRIPTNVSVDRIDSKKGYTRDNVQLVCMAINQMKSDLDNNTFYNLCKAVYKNAAKWKH